MRHNAQPAARPCARNHANGSGGRSPSLATAMRARYRHAAGNGHASRRTVHAAERHRPRDVDLSLSGRRFSLSD